MTDISPRRRVAGYATLGAALLAVPLTASITYAETPVPAPAAVPAPPVPPAAPAPLAAPKPPVAPAAPAPIAFQAITEFDPNTDVDVEVEKEFLSQQGMVFNDGDSTMVIEIDKDGEEIKHRRVSKERRVYKHERGEGLSKEERAEIMATVRESLAEVDEVLMETDVIIKEAMAEAGAARTEVKMECRGGDTDVATTVENDEGRTVYLCKAKIMAHALSGLKEARAEIAKDSELSGEMRSELLETLDQQIERWSES